MLYLTIGPFFAIPRCANTSFTVGLEQILPENGHVQLYILLFSALFFAAALFFSLRPGKILIWIGKILNPTFLLFLGVLVTVAADLARDADQAGGAGGRLCAAAFL